MRLATARFKPLHVSAMLSLAGLALFAGVFLLLPSPDAPQGLLLAFAFWSGLPAGAMALLLIHRLTGGSWGDALARPLRSGAQLIVLLAACVAMVLAFQQRIYPWVSGGVDDSVRRFYLNPLAFDLRTGLTVTGWLFFGLIVGRGRDSRLVAGLGLAFYGVSISFASVDWFLTLEPQQATTTFGAMIGVQTLLTALCVSALLQASQLNERTANDIGGLMLAMLLGVIYLELMTYIVVWYGNLPDKAGWYVHRGTALWADVLISAIIAASLAFCLLIFRDIRRSPIGLRIAAVLTLLAVAIHWVWLIAPDIAQPGLGLSSAAVCTVALLLLSHAAALLMEPEDAGPVTSDNRLSRHVEPVVQNERPPLAPLGTLLVLLLLDVMRGRRPISAKRFPRRTAAESPVAQKGNKPDALETPEVSSRAVLLSTFGFLGVIAIAIAGLGIYYRAYAPRPMFPPVRTAPSPQIAFPSAQARALRGSQTTAIMDHAEDGRLTIERAMALIASRGAAAYDPVGAIKIPAATSRQEMQP